MQRERVLGGRAARIGSSCPNGQLSPEAAIRTNDSYLLLTDATLLEKDDQSLRVEVVLQGAACARHEVIASPFAPATCRHRFRGTSRFEVRVIRSGIPTISRDGPRLSSATIT